MLIAVNILELHMPKNVENPKYVALKSIKIGLAKEYTNVGDDFETFS
jgi:hypothetical protein